MTEKSDDDIFLDDLRAEFLEEVSLYLIQLSDSIEAGDFDRIQKIAHDIKGTSGTFGLDEGSVIAKQIHEEAKNKNTEQTRDLINRLIRYMKESGAVFKES